VKTNVMVGLIVLGLFFPVSPSFAAENTSDSKASKLREAVICFPAKGIVKHLRKFSKLKAEKRDTVDMMPVADFEVLDGGALPQRFYSKDGVSVGDFIIGTDGRITDFAKVADVPETAELCIEDQSRAGTPSDGKSVKLDVDMDVQFLESSGYHSMATLKDGLKDGKSFYKKMAPGPMRMLVPKLSHLMINYDVEDTPAQFSAMQGQTPIAGLDSELFCGETIIKLEDIEELRGDGLQISGGTYSLMPVPGPKMLAKFAGCDDDEAEDDKED